MRTHTRVLIAAAPLAIASLIGTRAFAQSRDWISTDVGAVAATGTATQTSGAWTINGDGSDIWGTADSFQFLHQKSTQSGAVTVRVADLQNTSPFAKAGLMLRDGLSADAATVIFDVKPDGGLELMQRQAAGGAMQFKTGRSMGLPVWLRLEWGRRNTIDAGVEAWTSQDGLHWTLVDRVSNVSVTPEVGVAVTSHNAGQLTTAHVDHLTLDSIVADWQEDIVGPKAYISAWESDGVWQISAGGSDIWGPADEFGFVRRSVYGTNQHIRARIDNLVNTNAFAKAGVMLRTTANPDSPTVILDIKPDGGIEFMARETWFGEMKFLDGLAASSVPTWLDLSWRDGGEGQPATVLASASKDGISWFALAGTPHVYFARTFLGGVAVTSHNDSHGTAAQLHGLSLLPNPGVSDDIGAVGRPGNATTDFTVCCPALIVEGAGADIWGRADSFAFVHGFDRLGSFPGFDNPLIIGFEASHPFAKAGLMIRDGLDPGAPAVIVDVKPGGGIEFMARSCAGCEMSFIAGGQVNGPAVQLLLVRNADGSISAGAGDGSGNPATSLSLGTVNVPMANPIQGYAVTSHDPSRTAKAVFVHPIH